MDRRLFLRSSLLSFPLLCAPERAWTAAENSRSGSKSDGSPPRLLFVILRGGYDADSLLFQADNGFYHDRRPTISIGRKAASATLLPVAGHWFLHPAWQETQDLLENKELAFVPFAGSGDNSRSHFQAQDVLERGLTPDGRTQLPDGLINRILGGLKEPHAQTMGGFYTSVKPPACAMGAMNLAGLGRLLGNDNRPEWDPALLNALKRLYRDPDNASKVTLAQNTREEAKSALRQDSMMMDHGADNKAARGLPERFRQLGRLMKQGGALSLAITDISGWDTHADQGNENGTLARRLSELGQALLEYRNSMGTQWANTHVVVLSEFGRTFAENGSKGTDHGHASTMVLASGRPFDRTILGQDHLIMPDTLHEGRDHPVINEYRRAIGQHVLSRIGMKPETIERALFGGQR
jgi:uncharacterized protein (DUF1501 family)